jgi:hypothetical protein
MKESTMTFDLLVCCAPKDYNKLPFSVGAALKNIVGLGVVYVVTPTPIPPLPFDGIRYFLDRDILDIDMGQWRFRPKWIYQQFLKLFFRKGASDYYVTLDSDIVIIKPLRFFDEQAKPVWYLGRDQNHKPYFVFQKKMFGLGRTYPHSFINDMNFLNASIIDEMLVSHGMTFESFLAKSRRIINKKCYLAEPELYGSIFCL